MTDRNRFSGFSPKITASLSVIAVLTLLPSTAVSEQRQRSQNIGSSSKLSSGFSGRSQSRLQTRSSAQNQNRVTTDVRNGNPSSTFRRIPQAAPVTSSISPSLDSAGRLVRDARNLINSRTQPPQILPGSLATGTTTSPAADALSKYRREAGITDAMPRRAKEQLTNGTADLAGAATKGSVQSLRNAGTEDWKSHYDYAKGDATSRYSTETEGGEPAGEKTESTGAVDTVKNWFSSVFGTGVGNPAAKGVVGNGAGAVAGTAFGILTSNNTVEDKTNEANGIIGLHRQGKNNTINANAAAQLKVNENEFTPTHDGTVAGSPFTNKAVHQVTAWEPAKRQQATPKDMTSQPAEPGSTTIVKDLKAGLEKFEAVQNPNPSQDWAINYGDAVRGTSPVKAPVKAGYTPPIKDPVKPEMDGESPLNPK